MNYSIDSKNEQSSGTKELRWKIEKFNARIKEMDYQQKLLKFKIVQLQRSNAQLKEELKSKCQQIQLLMEEHVNARKTYKKKEHQFLEILKYLQQQVRQYEYQHKQSIAAIQQSNTVLKRRIQLLESEMETRKSIISTNTQEEVTHELINFDKNPLNNYIWKIQKIGMEYFKDQRIILNIVLQFLKSIHSQDTNTIFQSSEIFMKELSQYWIKLEKEKKFDEKFKEFLKKYSEILSEDSD